MAIAYATAEGMPLFPAILAQEVMRRVQWNEGLADRQVLREHPRPFSSMPDATVHESDLRRRIRCHLADAAAKILEELLDPQIRVRRVVPDGPVHVGVAEEEVRCITASLGTERFHAAPLSPAGGLTDIGLEIPTIGELTQLRKVKVPHTQVAAVRPKLFGRNNAALHTNNSRLLVFRFSP
jgi:hypothetical protein